MPSRNVTSKATSVNTARKDDIDDIPDELDDEPSLPAASSVHPTTNHTSQSGMSLDDLQSMAFDDERDEQTRQLITPPTGDWLKSERWKFQKIVYSGDCLQGDIDSEGRTVFVVSGKPDARQANGIEYQPQLFMRLSPDKRYKQDKPEEIDTAHKMYIKAKDVYLAIHGEKPSRFAQLINMLEDDNYVVRTMNGDSGPIVVELKSQVIRRR